jgi:hypothetical protein
MQVTGRIGRYYWTIRLVGLNAVAQVPCLALFLEQGGALQFDSDKVA